MPDRITLKRLTASDLTFFEWHFRNRNAGNQKSINLNADIFIEQLYPAAPNVEPVRRDEIRIPVSLTIFGPGKKGAYSLARKIVKSGSYKNWRLNGEFIYNPDNDRERFNALRPDDLALMIFAGEPIPSSVDMILIAAGIEEDRKLHSQLTARVPGGRRSMIRLSREDLGSASATAGVALEHPIRAFLAAPELEARLEDAAYGDEEAITNIRRHGRRISVSDLARARANADRVGRDGEGLVHAFLSDSRNAGMIMSVTWVSADDAAAPYDFSISLPSGENVKIDAKSTEGEFTRAIHISAAELVEAAAGAERYDIYRIYSVGDDGAKLRIARDIRAFARRVADHASRLPAGVRCDSYSVHPDALDWGTEFHIPRPDEPNFE